MPGPLGLPIDTYNFSKDDLRDKERFFSQACHEEENLNFYAVSFFRDLSPSNPDFHSVDHLRYAWKDDGLKISDEAKTLLRNKGWELVDARPENGKISIPVEGKTSELRKFECPISSLLCCPYRCTRTVLAQVLSAG